MNTEIESEHSSVSSTPGIVVNCQEVFILQLICIFLSIFDFGFL